MTIEELKITNEDLQSLKEMKNNCLKASVYEDEKRLLKANAITKFLVEYQEKQELIDYLKKEIKDGRPPEKDKYGNTLLWHMGYFDACKDILSKIEKE